MNEAKFTPGPWSASKTEPPGDWCIHAKGIPWVLAYITGPSRQIDWPVEANARLIAAAPDMLAALRDAEYALTNIAETFQYDDDDGPDVPCTADSLCGERACEECGCIKDKRDAARLAISKAEGRTP